eukprot:4288841-Pleurochrysis_carterae.AAC.2
MDRWFAGDERVEARLPGECAVLRRLNRRLSTVSSAAAAAWTARKAALVYLVEYAAARNVTSRKARMAATTQVHMCAERPGTATRVR